MNLTAKNLQMQHANVLRTVKGKNEEVCYENAVKLKITGLRKLS